MPSLPALDVAASSTIPQLVGECDAFVVVPDANHPGVSGDDWLLTFRYINNACYHSGIGSRYYFPDTGF